ncbi:MAG: hypothetical protein WDO73_28305 [Ignavibacteriota bacterium]
MSSVVQSFAPQAQAAAAGWLKAIPLHEIDLLRDIDEVLIASSGKGKTPASILVVTGRFDAAHLAEGAERYHGVPLVRGGASNSAVAVLDNATMIVGEIALVQAAIDQRVVKNRIDAALNDRITSMRQRYDIWGLGEPSEGIASAIPEAKMLESIDRFQFGMQLASGLELSAEIHARSLKDGEKLRDSLGMIAALLKGQNQSANGNKFDLQVEGGTLKLAVSISDEELKKAIAFHGAPSTVALASPAPMATTSDATEGGPNVTPEASPVAPVTKAVPASASKTTPAPCTARVVAPEADTVVFKLPGKK